MTGQAYVAVSVIDLADYDFFVRPGDALVQAGDCLTVSRNGQVKLTITQGPLAVVAFVRCGLIVDADQVAVTTSPETGGWTGLPAANKEIQEKLLVALRQREEYVTTPDVVLQAPPVVDEQTRKSIKPEVRPAKEQAKAQEKHAKQQAKAEKQAALLQAQERSRLEREERQREWEIRREASHAAQVGCATKRQLTMRKKAVAYVRKHPWLSHATIARVLSISEAALLSHLKDAGIECKASIS